MLERERQGAAGRGEPTDGASTAGSPGKRTRVEASSLARRDAGTGTGEGTGGGAGGPAVGAPGTAGTPGPAGANQAKPMDTKSNVTHETGRDAKSGKKDRTKVGVGELVLFSADVDGAWKASAATGATTATGSGYDWTAPATAATVTITFDPGGGVAVTTVTMEVIAPTIKLTKFEDIKDYGAGKQGAGMKCNVEFLPFDVSFGGVQWKESDVDGSNAQGYFKGLALPKHTANATWRGFNNDNTGPKDIAQFMGIAKPWDADGSYDWVIPQNYRLLGQTSATGMGTLTQTCKLEGPPHAGRTTVSKGGESASRAP